MYCPNCGWNNQAEVKFCTRCGTNLAVVSDALTGKLGASLPQIDERMLKLIKDHHKGRRDFITGSALIPLGVILLALMSLAGLKPIGAFFIICWIFFWGIAALASGLGKWLASSGEMKILDQLRSQSLPDASREQLLPVAEIPTAPRYATDPINTPGSITENTTRHLEERAIGAEGPKENQ